MQSPLRLSNRSIWIIRLFLKTCPAPTILLPILCWQIMILLETPSEIPTTARSMILAFSEVLTTSAINAVKKMSKLGLWVNELRFSFHVLSFLVSSLCRRHLLCVFVLFCLCFLMWYFVSCVSVSWVFSHSLFISSIRGSETLFIFSCLFIFLPSMSIMCI